MILRKLADAVRAQNWFTVIIEILIVVIGIFLGLQVTEWNESRKDKALAQNYIIRLLNEVHLADADIQYRFADKSTITDDLMFVVGHFHGLPENRNVTATHCRAIQHSHRFSDPEVDLPVVSELIATGNLDIITDNNIRSAITSLLLAQEHRIDVLRDIQSQRAVLSCDFPSLIAFSTRPEDIASVNDLGHECDFEGMNTNVHFKNKLLDNISRNGAYMAFWTAEMNAYNLLHTLVDQASGFQHPTKETAS